MRSTNGPVQDPKVNAELAAIDAALAERPVDAEFAETAELARALRAERPRPSADFLERLDAMALYGFARAGDRAEAKRSRGPKLRLGGLARRRVPLAFGTAASLLIVVTAVISSGVLSGSDGTKSRPGRPEVSMPQAGAERKSTTPAPAQDAAGGESASGLAAPSSPLPSVARERKVERDAQLTLATARDEIERTADRVIEVTDRYRGFVVRSAVSGGDDGRAGATLELRVPSARLQPALRDLSALAHVRSRTQTSQDITARFVSARGRLNEALTERRALLRQLARATTPNETASIRARLRIANRQIAAARANLRSLRNRVGFSSIAVEVQADPNASVKHGEGWTPGDAVDDALGILATALGVLIIAVAIVVPLVAFVALSWLVMAKVRLMQRERALDRMA
jgi:uncharacterized protein DUF4349